MLKYYTSSAYRKTYQILELLGLLDQSLDKIKPYKLGDHVLELYKIQKQTHKNQQKNTKQSKNQTSKNKNKQILSQVNHSKTFDRFLKEESIILKEVKHTPIYTFKLLLYIHTHFLIVRQLPTQEQITQLYQFLNLIIKQTNLQIEKYTKKQEKSNKFRSASKQSKKSNHQKSKQKYRQKQIKSFMVTANNKNQLFNVRYQSQPKTDKKKDNLEQGKVKRSQSVNSNQTNRSTQRTSTNNLNSQQIISKQIFLLMNVIKPYLLYLQKVLSIYELYQQLIYEKKEITIDECWCIINFFKLIGSVCISFSFMGRYFYKQFSKIVYLLIEYFSKEIGRIYPKLYKFCISKIKTVQHQYYQLCNHYSQFQVYHNDSIQISSVNVNQLVKIIEQISKVNQSFFHIYLGKYFYKNLQNMKIEQPTWLEATSKQCDFLFHFYQIKNKIKTKALIRTKQQILTEMQKLQKQNNLKKDLCISTDLKQNLYKPVISSNISSYENKKLNQIKKVLKSGPVLNIKNEKEQKLKLKLEVQDKTSKSQIQRQREDISRHFLLSQNPKTLKTETILIKSNKPTQQFEKVDTIYLDKADKNSQAQTCTTPTPTFTFRIDRKDKQKLNVIDNFNKNEQ